MKEKQEMTIMEVSRLLDVPESKLRYYEKKQLITPRRTQAGYRMYSQDDIARLRDILLLRYFDFSVEEIRKALADPDFSAERLISAQVQIQKENARHAETLAGIAQMVQLTGILPPEELTAHAVSAEQARRGIARNWNLPHLLRRASSVSEQLHLQFIPDIKGLLAEICTHREAAPDLPEVQSLIGKLYHALAAIFPTFPFPVFRILVRIYASEGCMAQSMDLDYGVGSARFFSAAVDIWCAENDGSPDGGQSDQ